MNRHVWLPLVALALGACGAGEPEAPAEEILSVVISGGLVLDGSDTPGVQADIEITDDRIVAIGDLSGRQAERRIDASGLAVSPGFIDIHSHAVRVEKNPG